MIVSELVVFEVWWRVHLRDAPVRVQEILGKTPKTFYAIDVNTVSDIHPCYVTISCLPSSSNVQYAVCPSVWYVELCLVCFLIMDASVFCFLSGTKNAII